MIRTNVLHSALDLDGEALTDGLKDIGADELNDTDADGLPNSLSNTIRDEPRQTPSADRSDQLPDEWQSVGADCPEPY